LIACQQQLLQLAAAADFIREGFETVVGQGQPAQLWRQCLAGKRVYAVCLEAHHLKRAATTNDLRELCERVVRAEQDAQIAQARQVIGQRCQLVAGKVEYFQAVGQVEDFGRKCIQVLGEIQAGNAGQFAAPQLFQCVHAVLVGPLRGRG